MIQGPVRPLAPAGPRRLRSPLAQPPSGLVKASVYPTSPSVYPMAENTTTFAAALLAGGLAGMAVDTAFFPIDTLKTRLQAQEGFVKSGGFSGVYRGLGSAVVGSAPGGECAGVESRLS